MDEIKKGIVGATKAIAKGSGSLIKSTKLTISLSNEEAKLNSLYQEIGKKVHEIYSYGGSLGEFFDKKYIEILEQQRKIEDLKALKDLAKGVVTCAKCGKTSPAGSTFCPRCGSSVGEAPPEQPPEPPPEQTEHRHEPPAASPASKNCNACGSANDQFDRFCLSCGRII